jgi:hypothetical protein
MNFARRRLIATFHFAPLRETKIQLPAKAQRFTADF